MGSYEDTQAVLKRLNSGLQTRFSEGRPINLEVNARPNFSISSFDPLIYQEYGSFLNRAPYIAGSLALRALLFQPNPNGEGAIIVAGLETHQEGYGFYMDSPHPDTLAAMKYVSQQLFGIVVDFTRA